jgi:hypothetical protein
MNRTLTARLLAERVLERALALLEARQLLAALGLGITATDGVELGLVGHQMPITRGVWIC